MNRIFSFQGKELLDSNVMSQDEREITDLGLKVEIRMQNLFLEESQYAMVGRDHIQLLFTQSYTESCQQCQDF